MNREQECLREIYRRMFKESEPSGDIDKMIASGEGKQHHFFLRYYLDQERQEQIIKEVCKEMKIPKHRWQAFVTECALGSSPAGSREIMLRNREKSK